MGLTCESYIAITEEFLAEARREGTARPDVRGRDLFLTTVTTSWVRGATLADNKTSDALKALTRAGWSK